MKFKDSKCVKCRFNVEHDYGYSNYTIEGTEVICLKEVHDGFDRWHGEGAVPDSINACDQFVEGEPTMIDVDMEDCCTCTPEQQARAYAGEDDDVVISLLTEYFRG